MSLKLSDYVANRLAEAGVRSVFGVSGGASLHLLHSVSEHPKIEIFCPHHEQAAAMAADGYARSTGGIGVTVATSGPGATNLVTGICGAFYDSVPMLCLTGQVSTFRSVGSTGARQIGFQETPIVDMCRQVTKYAVMLQDPEDIAFELDKCLHFAITGRAGPTLLDIPDNFQRAIIEPDKLKRWNPVEQGNNNVSKWQSGILPSQIQRALKQLNAAERPVVIAGWGIHLSQCEKEFYQFINKFKVPVVMTWAAADLLSADDQFYIGTFGTHGQRHANFAVQNADLILSLGSRLDTKSTGTPVNSFAREAKKIMVDVDAKEIKKFEYFELSLSLGIHCDLKDFFKIVARSDEAGKTRPDWFKQIAFWKSEFDSFDTMLRANSGGINPYLIIDKLFRDAPSETQFFLDTGSTLAWSMQAFQPDASKRIFHDFNNTAMGWALPACFGAWSCDKSKTYFCLSGDGSLMMNIQELATIQFHKMPLKLFVINNGGYAMIRQTQEQWLGSKYVASNEGTDLGFPSFEYLAAAFGFKYLRIQSIEDMDRNMAEIAGKDEACFVEIMIPNDARVIPQVKFGRPNEDMEPLLPRDIFERSMIVEPVLASRKN